MYLSSLQLTDYRNYQSLDFAPSQGLNLLVGPNGHGKSNLLEAVYLLATTRSIRAHRDQELVRQDGSFARVVARVGRILRPDTAIEIDIASGHKVGKINGTKHARLLDLLGEFNAVQFCPTDVDLVAGAPSDRRMFLNLQIAQTSGGYAYALVYYKRVLDQRNRLLRDAARAGGLGSAQRGALDALTDQLISHGGQILAHRAEFVAALAIHAGRFHQELTGGEAGIEVTYQPGWASTVLASGPPDADFRKALVAVQNEEMRRGTTLAGPHRDDLRFVLGGMDARIYASRGEQRTIALSLKLAELRQMEELAGEPPVLLLDDVMSELDDDRSRRVVSLAVRHYQVFVTGAAFRVFPPEVVEKASVFRVQSGAVELRQDGGSTQ